MSRIRRFYRNHLKRKMFNKIILLYSGVMMVLFAAAATMVYQYQLQRVIHEERDANQKTAQVLSFYLGTQNENIQRTIQQIYGNASVSADMIYFLNHSYGDYLEYRLDQFTRPGVQRTSSFSEFYKSYMRNETGVSSISIYSYPKQFYTSISRDNQQLIYEEGSRSYWEDWFVQRKLHPWNSVENDSHSGVVGKTSNLYSYSRELQDPETLEKIGMLNIEFDSSDISAWLQSRAPVMNGRVLVMTAQGTVIFDSNNEYFGKVYPYQSELQNTGDWVELDEPSKVNILNIGNDGLSVVGIVSKSEINASMDTLRSQLFIATLLFIIVSFAITTTMMRRYSKKVQRIIRSMNRIGDGDISTRIKLHGEDELQQISQRFNDMCDRIELYIDKMYTSELKQKHAELVALQSQIQPHFLYNTLESIRMKAYSMGAKDVGKMIYSLSVMFKSMVKKRTIVTLGEEIEMCSLYLELFQIRYEGRLQVDIHVDEDVVECSILKLLVQPIIENYTIHGFRSLEDNNCISLYVVRNEGVISIIVTDNGRGISRAKLDEINTMLAKSSQATDKSNQSIGLINVHERIQMTYGDQYGITIQSEEGIGTKVVIEIPALREGY